PRTTVKTSETSSNLQSTKEKLVKNERTSQSSPPKKLKPPNQEGKSQNSSQPPKPLLPSMKEDDVELRKKEIIESLKEEIGSRFEHQSEIIGSQLQDLNVEITIAFHQCNNAMSSAQTAIDKLQLEVKQLQEDNKRMLTDLAKAAKDRAYLLDTINRQHERMVQLEHRGHNLIKGNIPGVNTTQSNGQHSFGNQVTTKVHSPFWPVKK
ncbi:MAG: hypothetical protein ACRDF4_02775, partial [Rhabdochlamydiaceae bacterium]